MTKREIGESVCPRCKVRVVVRLKGGRICPRCESTEAWARYDVPGSKLVISSDDITKADARRTEGASRGSYHAMLARALPSILALVFATIGLVFLSGLFSHRVLGPLDEFREDILRLSRWTVVFGFLGFGLAVVMAIRLRRGRWFRSLPLLTANTVAIIAGAVAILLGGLHWHTIAGSDWHFFSMPEMDAASVVSPVARTIMEATVVVVAPDEKGNAHGAVIGSGAVIESTAERALIVTCSHVAMPYAAVASHRDASKALPVWVYLADGRTTQGQVEWTAQPPLDVAVIAIDISKPPAPVQVSPDSRTVDSGTTVMFASNPFRFGWMFHQGVVTKRDPHLTPVGEYSLLFTDLPVLPGDSGSGLYDGLGRLIGINTWAHIAPEGPRGISLPAETMRSILFLSEIDNPTVEEL